LIRPNFASTVNFWHDALHTEEGKMNQTQPTVAIISPGDMGHVVGKVLIEHGLRVITTLQGRSVRTRQLAGQAGIVDVGSMTDVVQQADLILSILVPDRAVATAQVVAQALAATGSTPVYVDCNAIAPQTARAIGQIITTAGSRYVDAGIIGPPPQKVGTTRFYASGPEVATFNQLNDFGLTVIPLGAEIGQASAFKMCYAALTKGLTALGTELLTAAEAFGISQPLAQEFANSQAQLYKQLQQGLPGMPAKAHRWIGEMEEIAQTFGAIGLTPQILAGAADLYRFVHSTPLGQLTPEDPKPEFQAMIATLAQALGEKTGDQ
jgi:3-hydroxyisobutyrate dehydrogenase-like beta-hydroxyacid dehydrogenase